MKPSDVSQWAHAPGDESAKEEPLTESEISRVMAAMGRKGGRIGGKRRLEKMTPERRREIALKAAQARWKKRQQSATQQQS